MSTQAVSYNNLVSRWWPIGFLALYLMLPLSIATEVGSHELMLPSELLLCGLAIGSIWYYSWSQWRTILAEPITLISVVHLGFMGFSISWSVDALASAKYVLIECLHWLVFYLGTQQIFKHQGDKNKFFRVALSTYLFSFLCIMVFAWYQHAHYHFSIDTSVLVARPFYFDHALYGSCAALLLGPSLYFVFTQRKPRWQILVYLLAIGGLLLSLYLSYSRAVWLSLGVALVVVLFFYVLRPKFWQFIVAVGSFILLIALSISWWLPLLQANQAESKIGTLSEQLSSIGNITSDVSNLERINRYSCAWRMFSDYPLTGFGTGTFQAAYLPYQLPEQMTRISVTDAGPHPPGRGGGAHSEYFQALAERGIIGALIWLVLIAAVFRQALAATGHQRILVLLILFSLCTFFVHGCFNNFLHTGKFAGLFWLLLAYISSVSSKSQEMSL